MCAECGVKSPGDGRNCPAGSSSRRPPSMIRSGQGGLAMASRARRSLFILGTGDVTREGFGCRHSLKVVHVPRTCGRTA